MTYTLVSRQVLATIKKYYNDDLDTDDDSLYPTIVENQTCAFNKNDRRRKYNNNKSAVTLDQTIVKAYSEFMKPTLKKINKHHICFLIYLLQNITTADDSILYNKDPSAYQGKDRELVIGLIKNLENEQNILLFITKNINVSDGVVETKIKEIKNKITNNDFSFLVKDFFKLYDPDTKAYKESVYSQLQTLEPQLLQNILATFTKKKFNNAHILSVFLKLFKTIKTDITFQHLIDLVNDVDSKIENGLKNIENNNFDAITIAEFFSIKDQSTGYERSMYDIIFKKEGYDTHISNLMSIIYDKVIDEELFFTQLGKLNTLECKGRTEELVMGVVFATYTLKDIGKFINLRSFCYCYPDLASMLISNKGLLKTPDIELNDKDRKDIAEGLGTYFQKNEKELQDDIKDIKDQLNSNSYDDEEKKIIKDGLGVDLIEIKDWKRFFDFMINEFPNIIKAKKVLTVYEKSCNTLFELLGLYGYMCLSDDLTVFDNDGSRFETAQYCTSKLQDVLEKIKQYIPELDQVSLNGTTLDSLKTLIETTCIHGVGNAFMRFYIQAYEAAQSSIANILASDKNGTNALLPVPKSIKENKEKHREIVENMIALSPFFIKAPKELKEETNIAYLTCIKYDESTNMLLQLNPLYNKYLLVGVTESPNSKTSTKYLAIIQSPNFKNFYKFGNIESYFEVDENGYQYRLHSYNNLPIGEKFVEHYNKNQPELLELINIPYKFYRQRKHTFSVFADYTLNLCKLMSFKMVQGVEKEKYEQLSKVAQSKIYDYLTLEETELIPKYMTVINLNNQKHMWNAQNAMNSPSSIEDRDYYVDNLENFLTLPYTYDGKAIVKIVTGKDVTPNYQTAQLLSKMLLNPKINFYNVSSKFDDVKRGFSSFESYFKMVHGQESEFRQSVFDQNVLKNNVKLKHIDGINILDEGPNLLLLFQNEIHKPLLQNMLQRMKTAVFLFMAYYHYFLPSRSKYYRRIYEKNVLNFNIVYESYISKDFLTAYKYFIKSIPEFVINECVASLLPEYTINEISKEYYLLDDIKSEYKSKLGTTKFVLNIPINKSDNEFEFVHMIYKNQYDDKQKADKLHEKLLEKNKEHINTMINILNTKFSYFNQEKLKIIEGNSENLHSESLPRAMEYIAKISLIDAHITRTNEFKTYEMMLRFVNSNKELEIKLHKMIEDCIETDNPQLGIDFITDLDDSMWNNI